MGRTRPRYKFIDEVNSVITGTIDPSDYDTAINTWMKDAWVDVIEYIESQNSTKIKKYEIINFLKKLLLFSFEKHNLNLKILYNIYSNYPCFLFYFPY